MYLSIGTRDVCRRARVLLANNPPSCGSTLREAHERLCALRLRGKPRSMCACARCSRTFIFPTAGVGEAARARAYIHACIYTSPSAVYVRARAAGIPRRRLLSLARVLNPPGKIDSGRRRESIPDRQAGRQARRQEAGGRQASRPERQHPLPHVHERFSASEFRERRPARRYADDAALDRSTRFLLA